jgi:peptidoglycan hydrolase-like protein with peptidoglycan-binding domain
MPNPGQPTIAIGATGDVVKRLQRALRRTPDLSVTVDGIFDASLEAAVKEFQDGTTLAVDGIVTSSPGTLCLMAVLCLLFK